jgi:hypothetical protein
MSENGGFDSFAVLELMGHVKMAGRVTEEERFGSKVGRIDVPSGDGGWTTVYFGGGSVYRMTVVDEDVARAVAAGNQPRPVYAFRLPPPEERPRHPDDDFDDEDDSGCMEL